MRTKTMAIKSRRELIKIKSLYANVVVQRYDNFKYFHRNDPNEWIGRKISGLPMDCIGLFADRGEDQSGAFVTLHIMLIQKPVLAALAA